MSKTPRPKIEILRLPSNERAKLLPLLEGGIQMQAEYKHHRSGDYASYSSLEEATNKRVFRSRLSALLKKLSPRPRRSNSKTPATPNTFPWVMIEFSNKEVKKDKLDVKHSTRCNSEDSSVSDRSFALTVSANKLRKEQALAKKNDNPRKQQQPLHHILRSLITPPRILIASPSPETSRVRMALQSYQNLLLWLHAIRSHSYVRLNYR
uniref:Uncharacterized protein n=1 Tax=Timema bartmani TaxID=61472 RepID=A0A7R9EW54_9NEOP|nr:unnamed protein product [Timema bartmani]